MPEGHVEREERARHQDEPIGRARCAPFDQDNERQQDGSREQVAPECNRLWSEIVQPQPQPDRREADTYAAAKYHQRPGPVMHDGRDRGGDKGGGGFQGRRHAAVVMARISPGVIPSSL